MEIVEVGIEQQKGRVNTIIEQALLDTCLFLKIPVRILHPTTWKKQTQIPCMGSNKQNKEVCVQLTRKHMVEFFGESKVQEMETTDEKRTHDYCDAFRIREATQNMHNSKLHGKKEVCPTYLLSDTKEKTLATSTPTLLPSATTKLDQ